MMVIDKKILDELTEAAKASPRQRMNYGLRNSAEVRSQRMLNALEPGTKVAIHRHLKTSESVVCLDGYLDWVFYEELPTGDTGAPIHD